MNTEDNLEARIKELDELINQGRKLVDQEIFRNNNIFATDYFMNSGKQKKLLDFNKKFLPEVKKWFYECSKITQIKIIIDNEFNYYLNANSQYAIITRCDELLKKIIFYKDSLVIHEDNKRLGIDQLIHNTENNTYFGIFNFVKNHITISLLSLSLFGSLIGNIYLFFKK